MIREELTCRKIKQLTNKPTSNGTIQFITVDKGNDYMKRDTDKYSVVLR